MDQTLQNDIFKEISKILTKKELFQTIDNYVDYAGFPQVLEIMENLENY